MKLKLRALRSSIGAILPKQMLNRLKLKRNDGLLAVDTPDGHLLAPHDPEIKEQLDLGRDLMKRFRETFRFLAK